MAVWYWNNKNLDEKADLVLLFLILIQISIAEGQKNFVAKAERINIDKISLGLSATMLFDLKTMIQPFTALSPQQKKLDRLIDKIEQQKLELKQWQQAEEDL